MSRYEKALVVLLMGSLWGALELFGADSLRALGVSNKSAFLFAFSIIILYMSKKLVDFAGSVVIMALIAGLFKTASSHFYACQFGAVMINGIVFDAAYRIFKNSFDASIIYRTFAAPIITYISFTAFAFTATYIIKESNWAADGLKGIWEYLVTSAAIATLLSLVTINIGYFLGNVAKKYIETREIGLPAAMFRTGSLAVVVAIWIAGQMY